jgi:hypothetical protein
MYASHLTVALGIPEGEFAIFAASYAAVGILSLLVVRGLPVVLSREAARGRNVSSLLRRGIVSILGVGVAVGTVVWIWNYSAGVDDPYFPLGMATLLVGISSMEVLSGLARGLGAIDRAFLALGVGAGVGLISLLVFGVSLGAGYVLILMGAGQVVGAAVCAGVIVSRWKSPAGPADGSGLTSLLFVGVTGQAALSADRLLAPLVLSPANADLYTKIAVLAGRPLQMLSVVLEQYFLPRYATGTGPSFAKLRSRVLLPLFAVGGLLMLLGVALHFTLTRYWDGIPLILVILAAYATYPIYSLLAAEIWARRGHVHQLAFLKNFIPWATAVVAVEAIAGKILDAPLVLAVGTFAVIVIRNFVMMKVRKVDMTYSHPAQ